MALSLEDRLDKLVVEYHQGRLTKSDVHISLIELMLEAPDDNSALGLCDSLPGSIRVSFRDWLVMMVGNDFKSRWFGIGDTRTVEVVESDKENPQAFLRRIGPMMIDCI